MEDFKFKFEIFCLASFRDRELGAWSVSVVTTCSVSLP